LHSWAILVPRIVSLPQSKMHFMYRARYTFPSKKSDLLILRPKIFNDSIYSQKIIYKHFCLPFIAFVAWSQNNFPSPSLSLIIFTIAALCLRPFVLLQTYLVLSTCRLLFTVAFPPAASSLPLLKSSYPFIISHWSMGTS
jgi:hypothetical protein